MLFSKSYKQIILLFLALAFSNCNSNNAQLQNGNSLNLHVPSPDWQDQIIYFVMVDRFNDGNPENNDQGTGEYDPTDERKFSGGDLEGIIQKLNYIKKLGATAVWVTPPVANQWWDPIYEYGGYHGYWAENFKKTDAHFGTLENYQQLSHQLHERGMYLIQDIVLNHTGNFFEYQGGYDKDSLSKYFVLNKRTVPVTAPTQYPFNLNNVRDPAHRKAAVYNWTPAINDYENAHQKLYYQMAGLDDINTENIKIREVLRDAYGYWIRVVGVDGFRIDTIIYVEDSFWADFMNAVSKIAPGMNAVANSSGRETFLTFGENFIKSDPMQNNGDKEVAKYQGTKEMPALNSMLNYPLYYTIKRVFAKGMPTQYLGYRLNTAVNDSIYKDPYLMVNFLDNHDWSRFISNSKPAALKQALVLLFTIPGIPAVYYGTEQLFEESRASMFASGWGADGIDHFDEHAEMFLFIQNLAELRKNDKVFSRGDLKILQDSEIGSGVLAYSRTLNDKTAIIIFNTADQFILMNKLETQLPEGTKLEFLNGWDLNEDLIVGKNGILTLELPPRSAGIFYVSDKIEPIQEHKKVGAITTPLSGKKFSKDIILEGTVEDKNIPHFLIINGKLKYKIELKPDPTGNWKTSIPISRFGFGTSNHSISIYSPTQTLASSIHKFSTNVAVQGNKIKIKDAANDDSGLTNNYTKPSEENFKGQMDIRFVEVTTFGGNLQLELTMRDFSNVWLPPNGFDHASFNIFFDFPNKPGQKILPKIHTNAPKGFEWNYMFFGAGWSNSLYSSDGATKDSYGTSITPTPLITANEKTKKITIQFPPDSFGNPNSLEGVKIYISTWDSNGSEGGLRKITKEGGPFEFGGSGDPNAPLILDDISVITISN